MNSVSAFPPRPIPLPTALTEHAAFEPDVWEPTSHGKVGSVRFLMTTVPLDEDGNLLDIEDVAEGTVEAQSTAVYLVVRGEWIDYCRVPADRAEAFVTAVLPAILEAQEVAR